MKRKRLLIAIIMAGLLISYFVSVSGVKAANLSIMAVADTYVESDKPDLNNGGSSSLYVYNYSYALSGHYYTHNQDAWLKFNLSEIPLDATVNSIKLRVHASLIGHGVTNKVGVFLCNNNSWTELGLTWNNAPTLSDEQPLQAIDVASANKDYDFDVTSTVKGKNEVSLVFRSLQNTSFLGMAIFDSRETSEGPRLVINYAMPYSLLDFGLLVIIGVVAMIGVSAVGLYLFKVKKKQAGRKK